MNAGLAIGAMIVGMIFAAIGWKRGATEQYPDTLISRKGGRVFLILGGILIVAGLVALVAGGFRFS